MSTIMFLNIPFILTSIAYFLVPALSQTPSSPFNYQGEWHLLQPSTGISAMHMQLLHNDKVIMFDRTDFGISDLPLSNGRCRMDPHDTALKIDCSAHSILYDIPTNTFRPLMVQSDTWCSSGSVLPNGTLVQTGGFNDGARSIRFFTTCFDATCDWVEFPGLLSQRRWYATNQILPDGSVIVVGGRKQYNYEFYPRTLQNSPSSIYLSFLQDTTDPYENNLYPFVHLLPNGNLFIFANTRSVLLDYKQNHVLKEFPPIPGGDPRNYPSSGSSVLLPLDENRGSIEAEVMVCGGAPRGSFESALKGIFMKALSTCGRLKVTDPNPSWVMENMPMPRAMGDMLLLPNGHVVIINGAGAGTAGWEHGREPVLTPMIFRPSETDSRLRFSVMAPASRPRLYHSSTILLKDGRVLVGGSNPHVYYNFSGVEYPTDLSLEAFSPPYLASVNDPVRPTIRFISNSTVLGYRAFSYVTFTVANYASASEVSVRILAPSFTTHSYAMNQRMVVLKLTGVKHVVGYTYYATLVGPSTAEIAPPGYYLLFVVHAGVPSWGSWVQVM
ncbi:aldehyde oxidase GLOX [Abrus precatorius]|uniref:Aldehyde oxidase GLOX n=1 Tax=Abrus precatorius TaxID=3816 RepID=A0A8B8LFG2_ABRPR|nr:aldehyde oxidase GLOX [Abrus precatorius]